VGVSGVRKGTFAGVVPPGQTSGGGGRFWGEYGVGRGGEVTQELVGRHPEGGNVHDGGKGERAKMSGPSVTEEGVNPPSDGRGKGRGDSHRRDTDEEACMIQAHRVVERDRAFRQVVQVGEEGVVDEYMVDERRAGARGPVGA